jgi:predicted alpha-1,6-mannanase (GH76 family)
MNTKSLRKAASSRAPIAHRRYVAALIAAVAIASAIAPPSTQALSIFEANNMINSYNAIFFVDNGTTGYYKDQSNGTAATWFWGQAEEIEMLIDSYERTGSSVRYGMITKLCNGFVQNNQSSWTWNEFNDDIMWATMAFTRAYQNTGNTTFLNYAKNNFDACYSRAWDAAGGGGMWWTTSKTSKNSCVNFPAAIAAYLLYQATGNSGYLTKATDIFNWGKAHLWDPNTGKIYDSPTNTTPTTYNQGTFIGIANFLGDVDSATKAADYAGTMGGTITPEGYRILPQYDPTGDGGGFNGIFMRWMAKFMGDRNLQPTYLPWLLANAQAAYDHRRTTDNLSWSRWYQYTPVGDVMDSFGCMSSVVATQVIPVNYVSSTTYALVNRKSGLALAASGGNTGNNTQLVQYAYTGSDSMKWSVSNVGGNQYKITGVASGRAVSVNDALTGNDAVVELFDYSAANHQKVTFYGNHGYYYTPIFVHSGKALTVYGASTSPGATIIQYTHNNGRNAQWNLRNP